MKWACGQRPYQAFIHSFLECACTRLFSIICFFLSISFNACEHLWVVRPSMNYLGHFYRIRLTRNRQNEELYIEQLVDSRKWRDSYPIWFGVQGDEQWNTIHRWFLAICRFTSSPFISFSFQDWNWINKKNWKGQEFHNNQERKTSTHTHEL